MSLQVRLENLEFYSSDIETIIIVNYVSGGTEAFVVPTTKIYVNETIDGSKFGKLLENNTEDRLDNQ